MISKLGHKWSGNVLLRTSSSDIPLKRSRFFFVGMESVNFSCLISFFTTAFVLTLSFFVAFLDFLFVAAVEVVFVVEVEEFIVEQGWGQLLWKL